MRTILYVDGFNLYFRMLNGRPNLKWLNIKRLAERLLRPENVIVAAKYYTARVSGRIDPTAPARQQIYLDALATVPEISVHMGTFLVSEKFAGMVKPAEFRPRLTLTPPYPDVVKVIKTEEKGSDVNLASHLLFDAFLNKFDVAAVLSNDSDLVEPIRIVTQEMGKPVGLLSPVMNPTPIYWQRRVFAVGSALVIWLQRSLRIQSYFQAGQQLRNHQAGFSGLTITRLESLGKRVPPRGKTAGEGAGSTGRDVGAGRRR